jgi:hypothetical protein
LIGAFVMPDRLPALGAEVPKWKSVVETQKITTQ